MQRWPDNQPPLFFPPKKQYTGVTSPAPIDPVHEALVRSIVPGFLRNANRRDLKKIIGDSGGIFEIIL
jgi:hypothetical protein